MNEEEDGEDQHGSDELPVPAEPSDEKRVQRHSITNSVMGPSFTTRLETNRMFW